MDSGRVFTDVGQSASAITIMTSADDGFSWTRLSTIISAADYGGTGAQEVGLEYLGSSKLLAMMRDISHTNAYQAQSSEALTPLLF